MKSILGFFIFLIFNFFISTNIFGDEIKDGVLRTPDERFENLKDYPFKPNYMMIDGLRIHYLDEGPRDGPILLAMHGQPVWSYLYARMIPILNDAGVRVIAPDLVGYGKSDKPAAREDYSYQNQVDWMSAWLEVNDFKELTFFGQDSCLFLYD